MCCVDPLRSPPQSSRSLIHCPEAATDPLQPFVSFPELNVGRQTMRHLPLLFLLACLSSCSGPLYVTLYNNSEHDVQSVANDEEWQILPGESQTITFVRGLQLLLDGGPVSYPHPEVPGKYYVPYKIMYFKIKLQLQPNRELLLLLPKENFPASTDHPQPEGFPLKPTGENA